MTTVEKAHVLAHIFESLARGVEIDYAATDPKNPDGLKEHYASVFNTLVRDIECIKSKAQSITWKPEVLQKLKCISITPENVDSWAKEQIRGGCGGCMACNRREECNYKALSICGFCKSMFDSTAAAPFTSLDRLMDDYVEFYNCYAEIESASEDKRKYRSFGDGFHEQDGGMLVMGETCHNRALLYNLANNWIFNWIYIVDNYIQDLKDSGEKIKKDVMYYNTNDDAVSIHKSFMEMQRLSVSETSGVDDGALSIDQGWWQAVKRMRMGNPKLLPTDKKGAERTAHFYQMLGRRGLFSMDIQEVDDADADADADADDDDDPCDSDIFGGSTDSDKPAAPKPAAPKHVAPKPAAPKHAAPKPAAPKPAAAAIRKRKAPEGNNHEASCSSEVHHDKRAELRNKLLKIKDRMVSSGDHEAAVTIMETVLELQG
jgi:hypothetical protein